MIRRMSMLVAVVLAATASQATAQIRGGPIYSGPVRGGGPSLFTGAYLSSNYPYPLAGAGFGSAYIGSIPYGGGGGGGTFMPGSSGGMYYPYNFSSAVIYPGAIVQSPQGQGIGPTNPPKSSNGSRSTGENGTPSIPSAGTGRAYFSIKVPADAKVWVNDAETKQTGAVRRFHTPSTLDAGKSYEYTFRAQWTENNQPVTRDRTVQFKPGDDTTVDLTEATAR